MHALADSTHSSTVQLFASSQSRPELMHIPPTHDSGPLQNTPSSQSSSNSQAGGTMHPIAGTHTVPAGQLESSGVFAHSPVATRHSSRVQPTPSLQSAADAQQVPSEHEDPASVPPSERVVASPTPPPSPPPPLGPLSLLAQAVVNNVQDKLNRRIRCIRLRARLGVQARDCDRLARERAAAV